jgi:uncharacterized membrane protein
MKTKEQPSELLLKQWHEDPKNWKLGVFYYNKDDSRIFPPKRFKWTGWTINFANSYSILALIAMLAIVIIAASLFTKLN